MRKILIAAIATAGFVAVPAVAQTAETSPPATTNQSTLDPSNPSATTSPDASPTATESRDKRHGKHRSSTDATTPADSQTSAAGNTSTDASGQPAAPTAGN